MTKEEMDLLVELISNATVEKLMKVQMEYDEQFKKELEAMQQDFKEYGDMIIKTDEDLLNEAKKSFIDYKHYSLEGLKKDLQIALDNEDYETAKILNELIKKIE